jgi:hypothetical protein
VERRAEVVQGEIFPLLVAEISDSFTERYEKAQHLS